jgi:hypothetical protein
MLALDTHAKEVALVRRLLIAIVMSRLGRGEMLRLGWGDHN